MANQAAIKAQHQADVTTMPDQLRNSRASSAQARVALVEAESARAQQQAATEVRQKQVEMIDAWISLGEANQSITTAQARSRAQSDWTAIRLNANIFDSNVTAVQELASLKGKLGELNQQLAGTAQDVADAVNQTRVAQAAQLAAESAWQVSWSKQAAARCTGNTTHKELGNWPDKLGCLEQLSVSDQSHTLQFVTYRSTDGWCEATETCTSTEPMDGVETFQRPIERPVVVLLEEEAQTVTNPMEARTHAEQMRERQIEAAAAEAEAKARVLELETARDSAAAAHDQAKDALVASAQTLRDGHAAIATREARATEEMAQIATNKSHSGGKFKSAEAEAVAAALHLGAAKSSWFRLEEICKVKSAEHEQVTGAPLTW